MAEARPRLRLTLQTKVMVAVLVVLVALPAITLWIVDGQLHRQMQFDAELALSTAQQAFVQNLKARTDGLEARFRTGASDARFSRILRLGDAPTMEDFLKRDLLDEFHDDTEIALFITKQGEVRGARRDNTPTAPAALAGAIEPFVQTAIGGATSSGSIALNGLAYHVIAIPVTPPEGFAGVLAFGIRISDAMLQKVLPPSAEILVIAGSHIAASTLKDPAQNDAVLRQLAAAGTDRDAEIVRLAGQRFRLTTGVLEGGAARAAVSYVLLSSSEQRLSALEQTRTMLLGLSAVGILVSAGVIAFFVRRITQPLVELRDSAEAIGRGDFSRRLERFPNDESGDLAVAFNQMTSNLQSSRAELERAMQQVKTTQEQLIQSEKLSAVGQFVAGVAHELNNPLTAVVGFSELLQSTQADERTRTFLDRIAKSAHRCHKIVQSLLSFARQYTPERKPIDLHTVIDEVLEIMAYELRTSDITIVREFAPNLPRIVADPHQLQQVFVNILSNARQAIEPVRREGRIIVRTQVAGDRVVVEFQDNGPGIRADHLARIFDPFFTTKPVGKGTGLGLSLCYGIIQEHGGKITARSEPGQGATFAIDLPVGATTEPAPALRAGSTAPFPAGPVAPSGKRILVIDDEEWILELARELLRAEGHEVETVKGGQQALELVAQRKFDVIVSDWKMPGFNGIRLYEQLRASDPAAARHVLFMTGDVVSDTFQEFLRANELTCLSKPFATREFRAAVAKISGPAGGSRAG
jgi:signal transduction histidine kinase/ActR/RegA family two-component response regulator